MCVRVCVCACMCTYVCVCMHVCVCVCALCVPMCLCMHHILPHHFIYSICNVGVIFELFVYFRFVCYHAVNTQISLQEEETLIEELHTEGSLLCVWLGLFV